MKWKQFWDRCIVHKKILDASGLVVGKSRKFMPKWDAVESGDGHPFLD